jgi:hypothetical protein
MANEASKLQKAKPLGTVNICDLLMLETLAQGSCASGKAALARNRTVSGGLRETIWSIPSGAFRTFRDYPEREHRTR